MADIDIGTDMIVAGFDAMRPILNLRADIQEWMTANIIGDYEVLTGYRRGYYVEFADEADAAHFKLRWA